MVKQIKLKKMSQTQLKLSSKQWNLFLDLIAKIKSLEVFLESNIKIQSSIFLNSLLEFEAVVSSKIEGTQITYDEIFYDIKKGIDNVYNWETRNLINTYKKIFVRLSNNNLRFNVERLKSIHENLYASKIKPKWNLNFDPSKIIKKIKPGKIIINNQTPNWIGPAEKGIEKATLLPIRPSKKIEWLEDVFEVISQKKIKKEWLIFFHPIFESIHPFSDGNGRIGRLLLTSLFNFLGITQNNWLFFSDIIFLNRNEYISQLFYVQTTGDWQKWIDYFLSLLEKIIVKREKQIIKIFNLFENIKKSLKILNPNLNITKEELVLKLFFKFPILNKQKAVSYLINNYNVSSASAYRAFDFIVKIIDAKQINNNQYAFIELLKIIKNIK